MRILSFAICLVFILTGCNPNYEPSEKYRSRSPGNEPPPVENVTEEEAMTTPERAAEFPGGTSNINDYLSKNIQYPQSAIDDGTQGKVYVEFTVQTNGNVTNVKIKRGIREDLDRECIRVIGNMPRWKPARSGGKTVAQRFVIPVNFKIG